MHPMLNIAIPAARRAGDIIVRHLERLDTVQVSKKGVQDLVTEVDWMAEQAIISAIHRWYPNHAILAEESGASGQDDFVWVIDPLDGTTNFVHGFPVFAVSIALEHKGRLELGVVYDPTRQELFSAVRGQGAVLNDRRIRVSHRKGLQDALLGTGFPYRDLENMDTYLAIFRELMVKTAGIRRPGSAALDLCYVAAGRLDGFWEIGLNEWDVAAGSLIIQEAGGFVGDFSGGDDYLRAGNIVAGTEKVYFSLLKTFKTHLSVD